MRRITTLVVHCSDSPDKMDIGVAEIRAWHLEKSWSDIGYHYVVRRSGVIEIGRPEPLMGAHVAGHNRESLGICWVGRDTPTETQYESLLRILTILARKYGVPTDRVVGHRELAPLAGKTCPNLDCHKLRADLALRNKAPA